MYFLVKYLIRLFQKRRANAAEEPSEAGVAGVQVLAATQPAASPRVRRPDGRPAAAGGPLMLLAHQIRYDLKVSLRNPRARFGTLIFPIILLVVFNGAFGSGHTTLDGTRITLARFYVPGIIAMTLVVGSYATLVQSITTLRETGVLKRRRATPVPAGFLIASQAIATVVVVAIATTLLLVIAKLGYSIGFGPSAIGAIACIIVVGTIACACVAYLVSGLIGSPEAAMPVVQASMLPLWFLSGVFIPTNNLSGALRTIGKIFPVEHIANSLHLASIHGSFGGAISASDVLILAAWAIAAAAVAAWRFSWLPSTAKG
jgi:ABC-2 type transport system permease protein